MAEEQKPVLTAKEFKTFERAYKQLWKMRNTQRDEAVGILSRDLLANRKEVTQNGSQKLVLQYGNKGLTVEYTLADLNRMAKAVEKQEGKFKSQVRGIPVEQVIQNSRVKVPFSGKSKPPKLTDYAKHKDVGPVTLYKIEGDTLHFRVGSSTGKLFYQVRIRLNDWDTLIRNNSDYSKAAHLATMGHVSFDCSCGRHQYWFRYLATIGGFALDPYEEAFPKIRNPKLIGVCCKHMVKTIGIMQSPLIRKRVEAEMSSQAKKQGWFTDIDKRSAKVLTAKDLVEVEQANEDLDVNKTFQQLLRDKEAFRKAAEKPENKEKVKKLQSTAKKIYKDVDRKKEEQNEKLRQKVLKLELESYLLKQVGIKGKPIEDVVATFAKKNKLPVEQVAEMAKKVKLK